MGRMRLGRWAVTLLLGLQGAAGCHWVLPYHEPPPASPDQGPTATDLDLDATVDVDVALDYAIPLTARYISPSGDDGNPGTRSEPWLTWSYALSQLKAGDVLVALAGTYRPSATGLLHVDCAAGATACEGSPCPVGDPNSPITVLAENERQAVLVQEPGGGSAPIHLQSCQHWRIAGLTARNIDDPDTTAVRGHVVFVNGSKNVELHRLLLAHNNRHFNTAGMEIAGSGPVLVRECEVYEFHKIGVTVWQSTGVVLRRNYLNGRDAADIPGGYQTPGAPDGADTGIHLFDSTGDIAENNVVENVGTGFSVTTHDTANPASGDDHRLVGNIALSAVRGFDLRSRCQEADPCTDPGHIASNNRLVDNIAVDCAIGFHYRGGQNNQFINCTSINHLSEGFTCDLDSDNLHLVSSVKLTNCLTTPAGLNGFIVVDQSQWSVDHCNAHGADTPYNDTTHVSNSTSIDPQLGGCMVYLPASSPLKGAGKDGADIGGNVVYRLAGGKQMGTKLWDQTSGQFPCGAEVATINDTATFPDASCATVHQRLNVGQSGCPVP